jgi:NAD(P)-dependent dehydrogenase (short-subunit alcohol dehydrogenase family)
MDLGLKGKKVIINGGGRGIGRAALEIYAQEGCDIAFFSRHEDKVADTKAVLEKSGGKVFGEVFDMSKSNEAYAEWLKKAADQIGGCDIFIHNASSSGAGGTGDWQMGLDLDIMGGVTGAQTLEPYLTESGAGSIIMMSSTAAFETFIQPQAFNALKAAVITYAKQLSQAWASKNIRVNIVSPGPVEYPGGNWDGIKQRMKPFYDATTAQVPLGRLGAPEDVARAMVFLSSPAASYITGTNIVIDGGYTKRVQF